MEENEKEGFWIDTDGIVAKLTEKRDSDKERGGRFWEKINAIKEHGTNDYSLDAELLPDGWGIKFVNLKPGDLVLAYDDYGSTKHHAPHVVIAEITSVDEENKSFNYKPIIRVVGLDWARQILTNIETMKLLKQILTIKKKQ